MGDVLELSFVDSLQKATEHDDGIFVSRSLISSSALCNSKVARSLASTYKKSG